MLHLIFLKSSPHRGQAHQWMDAHDDRIQCGVDEGSFESEAA